MKDEILELDEVSLKDYLESLRVEGYLTDEDIYTFFKGKRIPEKISGNTHSSLNRAVADAIGSKVIKSKSKLVRKDIRLEAFDLLIDTYEEYGLKEGKTEIKFHNEIMSKYNSMMNFDGKHHYGRDFRLLLKVVEILRRNKNYESSQATTHAGGLLKALQFDLESKSALPNIGIDRVYQYMANQVSNAKNISRQNKNFLIGKYFVFRLAYYDPREINISVMDIVETNRGSLISKNIRTNKNEALLYESEGMVFQTSANCVSIYSSARSVKERSVDDQFYESIMLRVKWSNHSRSGPLINGLYQGLCTDEQFPFATRVFLLKQTPNMNKNFIKKYSKLSMTIPLRHFTSKKIKAKASEYKKLGGLSTSSKMNQEWIIKMNSFESEILSRVEDPDHGGNLDIDKIRDRITNGIDMQYEALRHYSKKAKEKYR